MTAAQIRQKYLDFFKSKGHAILPSASLVPENDPTTLFTGSGMQPMIPYLLGEKHPQGGRLVDSQKCFRSGDIEDIGDNRHTTFFEMLGNWSLGDYFKKEQIEWMFEFLTSEIGIDPKKLYVSVFIGDEKNAIPKDTEAAELWQNLFNTKAVEANIVEIGSEENGYQTGMQGGRIFYYDSGKNWWSRAGRPENMPVGEPGGPDSELFYDFGTEHDLTYGPHCHPNCDCGRFIEIGNNVFMEYQKNEDGSFSKLPQRNVDFGGGFERIVAAHLNMPDVFQIDIFKGLIETLEQVSGKSYHNTAFTKAFRVVADHLRAAAFLIGDGVVPTNTDQGYFVRRLIRRAVRYCSILGVSTGLHPLVDSLLEYYKDAYPDTFAKKERIREEIKKEEEKFAKTLEKGIRELEKMRAIGSVTGEQAFILFSTYGFPLELTEEMLREQGQKVDRSAFAAEFKKHQDLSRTASAGVFKGGLADHSAETTRLHTATHLLHKALKTVLGDHVEQKGSNITAERLRFDFSHAQKMTPEELQRVEAMVNDAIQKDYPVAFDVMSLADAKAAGALGYFEDKYAQMDGKIKVYTVGDATKGIYSREICGGPHVAHTGELGSFKIQKEEAVSAGVRRIKAIVSGTP